MRQKEKMRLNKDQFFPGLMYACPVCGAVLDVTKAGTTRYEKNGISLFFCREHSPYAVPDKIKAANYIKKNWPYGDD